MLRKNLDDSQTIFALATGGLPSAIAIVRMSGKDAFGIASQIFYPKNQSTSLLETRTPMLGDLKTPEDSPIDEVLVLSFRNPNSYTGEDLVEFQCHGSIAVVEKIYEVLSNLGARPAEKGEFSYRAFLNKKISERSLENLGDVFCAKEAADLNRIYYRRDDALEAEISELRKDLIEGQAILDTAIDFSDEYSQVISQAQKPLISATQGVVRVTHRYENFKLGLKTPKVVLAGRTNAGKSSLFNAILNQYRAIVDSKPGTTRDVVEEDLMIAGRRWKIADTAGIRAGNEVEATEKEGMGIGSDYLAGSDFWILVVDGSSGLSDSDRHLLSLYKEKPHLVVWNKWDLDEWSMPDLSQEFELKNSSILSISALKGKNLRELWVFLEDTLKTLNSVDLNRPLPTNSQFVKLKKVENKLENLMKELSSNQVPEVIAEENRQILDLLDGVIGYVDQEMVLDRVFSDFCIGK